MALAPYNPAALGPSQAAAMDTLAAQNNITDAQNSTDKMIQQGFLTQQYKDVTQPQLESSMGSAGQFYGTQARRAEGQSGVNYQNQMYGIESAFTKAHNDLQRQQVFASMGLIL
jgi:hypothetical protein